MSSALPPAVPPSFAKVVWLLTALEARRVSNRLLAQFSKKGAQRTGTARKRVGSRVVLVFLGVSLFMQVLSESSRVIYRSASLAEQRGDPSRILVSEETLRHLKLAEAAPSAAPGRDSRREDIANVLLNAPWRERSADWFSDAERRRHGRELLRHYERHGRAGFRPRHAEPGDYPSESLWYGGDPRGTTTPLALISFLCALGLVLIQTSGGKSLLASVESRLVWYFAFPVPVRGVLFALILQTALTNVLGWMLLGPFFFAVFWCAGVGIYSLPAALLATLYVGLLAGSTRVVLALLLRRCVPPARVASVQSALSLIGALLLLLVVCLPYRAVFDTLADYAYALPDWLLFSPPSLPISSLRSTAAAFGSIGAGLLSVSLAVTAALRLGRRVLADGLTDGTSTPQGRRGRTAYGSRPWRLPASAAKELLSIVRNQNRFLTVFVSPCLILLPYMLSSGASVPDAERAGSLAALTFGVAATMLVLNGTHTLANEGNALWLLCTTPRSLERTLLDKSMFWALLSVSYGLFVATLVALYLRQPAALLSVHMLLTLLAGALYAWIGVALGALGTDALATEERSRLEPTSVFLFMALAAMFTHALYTPSWWTKFAQLTLSCVLIHALWQKLRDRIPYLLDPTEVPPPRVAAADGIVAAICLLVLTSCCTFIYGRRGIGLGPGLSMFAGFSTASLLIAAGSLYVFWRSGVPELRAVLGLSAPEARVSRALSYGLAAGLGAGAVALGYLWLLTHIGWVRDFLPGLPAAKPAPDQLVWWALLLVVAAPVSEEFIFRGVLYRGMARSFPPLRAALLSALWFALLHPPVSVLPVFILGILAALSLERTRLLLAPIVAHMTYNALIFVTSR